MQKCARNCTMNKKSLNFERRNGLNNLNWSTEKFKSPFNLGDFVSLTGEQEISAVSGRDGIYAFLGWKWGRKEEHEMLCGTRGKNLPHKIKNLLPRIWQVWYRSSKTWNIWLTAKLFSLQHFQNYDLIEWHTPKWRGLPFSPHLFFKVEIKLHLQKSPPRKETEILIQWSKHDTAVLT